MSFLNTPPPSKKLEDMVSKYAGLKSSEVIARKLSFILKGLPEAEMTAWLSSLAVDPLKTELQALVEDLTNHETYFFRDPTQLKVIEEKILPEMIDRKISQRDFSIIIWSAGCSSGEEVYTLAMILLQVFIKKQIIKKLSNGLILPPAGWRIQINGTDISRQMIRKASEGIYENSARGLSSFRSMPKEYMEYFTLAKTYEDTIGNKRTVYHINDIIKSFVKFDIANLMSPVPPVRHCDLVLCKNVMIYLHDDARTQVEMVVRSALKPSGILMFSAVDKLNNTTGMESHNQFGCVYYEKK